MRNYNQIREHLPQGYYDAGVQETPQEEVCHSWRLVDDYDEDSYDYDDYEPYYDERTYDRYNGSYAQDVEGWSDQDIDDVFDGDPEAYWNID